MAGPRPDDSYNPVPTVSPSGAPPNDYLNVRVNPNQMGAQVGQAIQGLGKTVQDTAQETQRTVLQAQGLANEHEANTAEYQFGVASGQIYEDYKSLKGMAASNAKDKAVSDILTLNQKVRSGITNPAAQRAYDTLVARQVMYTVRDMNSYAGGQRKEAYTQGQKNLMELAKQRAASFDVASNPDQMNNAQATVISSLNANFTAPDYGLYSDIPVKQGKDGRLQFNTSDDRGRLAQADYDLNYNKEMDQLFTNQINALAYDNVSGSYKKASAALVANQKNMSPATYNKLSKELYTGVRNEDARDLASKVTGFIDQNYQNFSGEASEVGNKIRGIIPGATITSTQRTPEHNAEVGGVPDSQHLSGNAMDLVLPKDTTFEAFKQSLTEHGIETTELINEKDHVHVAWGDKSSGMPTNVNKADYIRLHYNEILERTRQEARTKHDDAAFEDTAVARVQQRLNNEISQQDAQTRAYKDIATDYIGGKGNHNVPLTSMDQVMNGPPEVKSAVTNWLADDPYGNIKLNNLLSANSHGQSTTYGTKFWDLYNRIGEGSIHDPSDLMAFIDPNGGQDSTLTNTGFNVLKKMVQDGSTPQGKTTQKLQVDAFNTLHQNMIGNNNAKGDQKFTQFLMKVLPQIEAERKSGGNVGELFDSKSNKYIGKELDAIYPPSKRLSDFQESMLGRIPTGKLGETGGIKEYGSLEDLKKDVGKGISRASAIEYAKKQRWVSDNAPPVPAPH